MDCHCPDVWCARADKDRVLELWVNLDQPYAQRGSSSRYFKRSDFVVVSQSPRHLLVHAQNEDLDFWLLSAHAPHGGTALHPTDRTSSGSTSLHSIAKENLQDHDLQYQSRHCECQNVLSWWWGTSWQTSICQGTIPSAWTSFSWASRDKMRPGHVLPKPHLSNR